MEKSIIFRRFRTYRKNYVYDRHMNAVIAVDEDEFNELRKVEKAELAAEKSAVIAKYQKEGLFKPNVVEKIWHPQTDIVEHHTEKKLQQLTLQVTQQCNLRCEYCIYSGIYDGNRTHANKRMNFEVARKAIDFFLEHSIETSDVVIGFYGGEPLLEFELIRRCVEYANERCEGKRIQYNITTNATLLKGEVAKFLVEHDFDVSISLDGSKEEHNASRKFKNGEGSFDVVIQNLKTMMEKYPEFEKRRISILTTVNPYMDLGCVLDYFKTSDILGDKAIMFNTMVPTNLKEDIPYGESYFEIRRFEYVKTLFYLAGKLDKEYVSKLTSSSVDKVMKMRKALHGRFELPPVIHHGGPCMPGVLRLFVRCDGALFPCERVNEQLEYYQIGTVNDGFNLKRVKDLLNIGKITEEECKECWNLRQCIICSNQIEFHGADHPSKKNKLAECEKGRNDTEFDLYEQCVLAEFGYTDSKEGLRL